MAWLEVANHRVKQVQQIGARRTCSCKTQRDLTDRSDDASLRAEKNGISNFLFQSLLDGKGKQGSTHAPRSTSETVSANKPGSRAFRTASVLSVYLLLVASTPRVQ